MHVAMLPGNQRILPQVLNIFVGQIGMELEHEPAHVRVEEALRDIVGIFVMINMLVVGAMLATPHQRLVLKRTRAKDQGKQLH